MKRVFSQEVLENVFLSNLIEIPPSHKKLVDIFFQTSDIDIITPYFTISEITKNIYSNVINTFNMNTEKLQSLGDAIQIFLLEQLGSHTLVEPDYEEYKQGVTNYITYQKNTMDERYNLNDFILIAIAKKRKFVIITHPDTPLMKLALENDIEVNI